MTKITMLHFASPFAFSMPAPVQSPVRPAGDPLMGQQGDTEATTARPDGADALSTPLDVSSFDGAEAHAESEGFADSAFATALRRYLEQQGEQTGVGPEVPGSGDETSRN